MSANIAEAEVTHAAQSVYTSYILPVVTGGDYDTYNAFVAIIDGSSAVAVAEADDIRNTFYSLVWVYLSQHTPVATRSGLKTKTSAQSSGVDNGEQIRSVAAECVYGLARLATSSIATVSQPTFEDICGLFFPSSYFGLNN